MYPLNISISEPNIFSPLVENLTSTVISPTVSILSPYILQWEVSSLTSRLEEYPKQWVRRVMVKPQTSDIWMTYEYIRVTYSWHTSTYEWHTSDIWVHTSDIRMIYEYKQATYWWHTSTYEWPTDDTRVTHGWYTSGIPVHTNDIRMTYEWHLK